MKIRKALEHLAGTRDRQSLPALAIDPTEFADPLFGVGSATSAGPTLPAGSIHPSPETLEKDCGGYLRNQPIVGFGHAYVSGSGGTKCYGNFLLAPMVGGVELDHARRASYAVKGEEHSSCYEYSVTLENGICTRFTPAQNSAIHSIEFPAGKEASLIMDVGHKLDIDASMRCGTVTVDGANKCVYGGGTFFGNWSGIDWNMYFAMMFDRDFEEIGVFMGEKLCPIDADGSREFSINKEKRIGAYIKFGTAEDKQNVKVKVAISFVSPERALEFLDQQIPAFDYVGVREAARNTWRGILSAIEIHTEDKALLRRFYTAMYHLYVQPRNRTADHGKWDDFHTIWDTWKTAFPLKALLTPEETGEIIDSMLDRAIENEKLGNGIVIADEYMAAQEGVAGQGGNDVENVIVDAYFKGVPLKKYSWEDAYRILLKSAETMRSKEYVEDGCASGNNHTVSGIPYTWRFRPGTATLGFAFNDKAIANAARELGTYEDVAKYEARSANWRNTWNMEVESEGFRGFPQARNEQGMFDEGFDAHGGYTSQFYEATGWDASYINYNDVDRLIETMGGPDTFTKRLLWACEHSVHYYNDDGGKEGYLNFTNEPSFHIPWLFCTDQIRRPDLAAKVIDGIITRFSLEDDYPGDEDNGGMASYYIFLMSGIFPFATTENYYLHGTRVDEVRFRLGNGREFVVTGENVGAGNIYVQSALWQGEPLHVCKLTHEQIMGGGQLHFVMGDQPSDWAKSV